MALEGTMTTTVKSDDLGAVSIPPDLLRTIGVPPKSPVKIEVQGACIVIWSGADASPMDVEIYTPERKAELLLNNAVDADDYAEVLGIVRGMGLDPSSIPHERPAGA
jgi:hypothetical protein